MSEAPFDLDALLNTVCEVESADPVQRAAARMAKRRGWAEFRPTEEQQEFCTAALRPDTNIIVQAFAGTAKSTSLELVANCLPPQPTLYLVFNYKNKVEAEKAFPDFVKVMTLNGLGHQAWSNAIGKRLGKPDTKKLGNIVKAAIKAAGGNAPEGLWDMIRSMVNSAMLAGLVPSTLPYKGLVPDTPEVWQSFAEDFGGASRQACDLARHCLIESIRQAFNGEISFDDQIYCSAMLGGVFPKYGLVLGDEVQDWSALNRIMAAKAASGRIFLVGDAKQSIYSFRGADAESFQRLRDLRPEWVDLKLSLTFRCPKKIVARQQEHVPGFRAHEANIPGEIVDWSGAEDPRWNWDKIDTLGQPYSTVLCRNTAPLLSLAFKLIRRNIGVQMQGRDIGKGLIALSKKIMPDDALPANECAKAIHDWAESQVSLARANDQDEKIDSITDRAECLNAILEGQGVQNAGGLRFATESLFSKENGRVLLSTIHRAKGLEWPLVIHIDPHRLPSRWAKEALRRGNPIPMEQELNLNYVAETRTKNIFVLANLEHFQ